MRILVNSVFSLVLGFSRPTQLMFTPKITAKAMAQITAQMPRLFFSMNLSNTSSMLFEMCLGGGLSIEGFQ